MDMIPRQFGGKPTSKFKAQSLKLKKSSMLAQKGEEGVTTLELEAWTFF